MAEETVESVADHWQGRNLDLVPKRQVCRCVSLLVREGNTRGSRSLLQGKTGCLRPATGGVYIALDGAEEHLGWGVEGVGGGVRGVGLCACV